MQKCLALLASLFLSGSALAQSVQQSGTITPGHAARWTRNGVIQDAGTAANGSLTSLGVTATGDGICQNSDVVTAAGWQRICLGSTTAGGGYIAVQNFGTATPQNLTFWVNGVAAGFSGSTIDTNVLVVHETSTLGTVIGGTWNGSPINLTSYATGTLQAAQFPALTGDVTTTAGSLATAIGAGKVTSAMLQGGNYSSITGLGTITSGVWNGTPINLSLYASGTLQADQFPTLTGDVTTVAGSLATTVAKINGATLGTTTATSGNLLIGSGSTWDTQPVTGDITITSAGVTAIGAGKVVPASLASGTYSNITGFGTVTSGTLNGVTITGLASPSNATDAVNKSYVDSVAVGINIHPAVVAASTANLTATYNNGSSGVGATLTNSGAMAAFSIDGVSPSATDRVLIKNQTTGAQNGCYTVTTVGSGAVNWVLTRCTDENTAGSGSDLLGNGDYFFVSSGSTQAASSYVLTTPNPIVIGTTALVFTQFSAAPTYSTDATLALTGSVFSLVTPVAVASGGTGTTTAFTSGSLVFAGGAGVYSQDNANLFWNSSTHRLGLGTTSPSAQLDVVTSARMRFLGSGCVNSDSSGNLSSASCLTTAFTTGSVVFASGGVYAQDNANFFWNSSVHRLGLGTTSPTAQLDIVTSARMRFMGVGCVNSDSSGNLSSVTCPTGTVTGPGTSVVGHLPSWGNTGGTALVDSGEAITVLTGVNNAGNADVTSGYNSFIATCQASTSKQCKIPDGIYRFDSQPNCITTPGTVLYGEGVVTLIRNYSAVGSTTGLVCLGDGSNGSEIRRINAESGWDTTNCPDNIAHPLLTPCTGGAFISVKLSADAPSGAYVISDLNLTVGRNTCGVDYDIFIDGSASTTIPGIRSFRIFNTQVFGAAVASQYYSGIEDFTGVGITNSLAGCLTQDAAIYITGSGSVPSHQFILTSGQVDGGFNITRADHVTIIVPSITPNAAGFTVSTGPSADRIYVMTQTTGASVNGSWTNSSLVNLQDAVNGTKTVRNSAGTGTCTFVLTGGLVTGGTC